MKVRITVTELSHEDLVDILSTALYGCDYLGVGYDHKTWEEIPEDKKEGHCYEDHLADMLLNGHWISITDFYAEGEIYKGRKHPMPTTLSKSGNATYCLALQDILWACNTEHGYKLLTETLSGEGDYFTANNLLQIALFGEEIYG